MMQILGFRVQGSGSGLRVWGIGFRVFDLGLMVMI
jgi:hypothetical protein